MAITSREQVLETMRRASERVKRMRERQTRRRVGGIVDYTELADLIPTPYIDDSSPVKQPKR